MSITTDEAPPSGDRKGSGNTIERDVAELRRTFESGATRSLSWRERQLDGLIRMIRDNEELWSEALQQDLGKPPLEAFTTEINFAANQAVYLRKNLRKWARPRKVRTSLIALPGRSEVVHEPLGVVLVIGPWNYPLELALTPVAGALSAGNAVLLKPSEVAPATSKALARLIPRYLDGDAVRVVEGGAEESTQLLRQRFDHIFYTGNGRVGRIVMRAAAEHLTPVTLELGGKSPTIVDAEVDVEQTARRIVMTKFYNCGQTCVAPDHVLVHARAHDALVEALKATIVEFWGKDPQLSPDYGRIVNAHHHRRVTRLLVGQSVIHGGVVDETDRYIAPTLLSDVEPSSPVMQEEIFGPLLPVLRVDDVEQAIQFVNARPKPLALYLYSRDKRKHKRVARHTSSGGLVINHGFLHLAVPELPFGGVGESGMGAYHGRRSFETFSHEKAVLTKPLMRDPSLLSPPYSERKQRWIRRLL